MQSYLNQATYNLDFLDKIKPIEGHFDWKITVCFYVAIHWMKAYLLTKNLGEFHEHKDIGRAISHTINPKGSPVSKGCWMYYNRLYTSSKNVRYNGFGDIESFDSNNEVEYKLCLEALEGLRKYFVAQKLLTSHANN